MRKISKKDQDPTQVEQDGAALAVLAGKKSEHFAVGTYVMANNRRGEILESLQLSTGNYLRIAWEDGSITYDKPLALNNHVSRR